MSSKDSDFWKQPVNWDSMSEEDQVKWMFARFKAEEDEKSKPEMYCTRCKGAFFKYTDLHIRTEHAAFIGLPTPFIISRQQYESQRMSANPETAMIKESILWSWGIDPARERDFNALVIQGISSKKIDPWLPRLRDIYRFRKQDYVININFLIKDIAPKYPPAIIHVDSTRDPTFAELITRKFGSHRVNSTRFQNVGNTNTKLDLKLIGKGYIQQGYTFPDVDQLLRLGKISADKAFLVKELKTEALREIAKLSPKNGSITFDQSKHNDLVHAWEMSLKGIMEIQKNRLGEKYSSLSGVHGATLPGPGDGMSNKERIEKTLVARIKNRNWGTDVSIHVNLPEEDLTN